MRWKTKKWWGKTSVVLLTFFVVACSSYVVIKQDQLFAQDVQVESTFDDGPYGESIADLVCHGRGLCVAITEEKEVYMFSHNGDNGLTNGYEEGIGRIPKKVKMEDGSNLGNVERVFLLQGSLNTNTMHVLAETTDHKAYVWGYIYPTYHIYDKESLQGVNLSDEIVYPKEVSLDADIAIEDVKDIDSSYNLNTGFVVLLKNGDVYAVGESGNQKIFGEYFGEEAVNLTKLAISNIDQIFHGLQGVYYVEKGTGQLWGSFRSNNPSAGAYSSIGMENGFRLFVDKNDNPIQNTKFLYGSMYTMPIPPYIITDTEVYTTIGDSESSIATDRKYGIFSDFTDRDASLVAEALKNIKFVEEKVSLYKTFITNDNRLMHFSPPTAFEGNGFNQGQYVMQESITSPTQFYIGTFDDIYRQEGSTCDTYEGLILPKDYRNAKKVYSFTGGTDYILTNNGSVYQEQFNCSGVYGTNFGKLPFGSIMIKGTKNAGGSYRDGEKYNQSVTLQAEKTNTTELSALKYTITDLIGTDNQEEQDFTSGDKIGIIPEEGKRFYKRYDFYLEGSKEETLTSYTVDLFKKIPELSDVVENRTYRPGKTIALGYNGFGENKNTATLQKEDGEALTYTGEAINELGNYTLVVSDQYGNTNTYHFRISEFPEVEELIFTPSTDSYVYDSVQTKPNGVLGDFSLRYAEGEEQADIDTMTIDSGDDLDKFEIVEKQLKVKGTGTQLDAGTYTLQVSGTDSNGMSFSGSVTIVVEKAEQDTYQITNVDMIFELDKIVPIITTGKKGDGAETFDIIEGKDTIASMNDTTNYQMKSVGSFKLQATVAETQNYKGVTVEKVINLTEMPEQPGADSFTITSADTIMYGDNNNIYVPTVSDDSQGTITWSVTAGTDVGQLNVDEVNILKVGQFTIQATRSMSGYKDLVVSKEVTVTPRITTVTPNQITKLEGQTWASVIQNGVTFEPELVASDVDEIGEAVLGYASGYDDNTGQGTYPEGIEIKNQFDNENYVFTYEKGVLEVIGEDLEDGNVDPGEDGQNNPYYSVSGTKGKNGWYLSDITITSKGKDGYDTLSIDKEQFSESIVWTQSGEHDVNLYFKHNTTFAITNPLIYHAKIDKDLPTIQIQYAPRQRNFLESIVNFLSFDHYFSEAQSATFIMSDATSGVNTAHYTITEVDGDGTPIGDPVTGSGNSYALDENKNYKIEVYAEDVAGNVSTTITELVSIDATAANVIVKGSVDGQDHPTSTWTYKPVTLTPEMEDGMDAETWEYSIDGGTRQTLTGTSLVRDNNLVREETIVFYGTKPNGSTGSGSYIVKIDPIKPVVELSAENEDGTIQDGETSHDLVTLTFRNTAGNVSGTTYQCSTNGTSYSECTSPITVSGNGSYHYYVKAISGAGLESDVEEITFTIEKLVYEKVNVNVVELESPSIPYVSGTWANKDVQFTLNGGIVGGSNIAYEYAKTTGSTLSGSETWNAVTGNTLTVSQETAGEYYWFRVKDNSTLAYVSNATLVKLDKTNPDVPTLTMKTVNDGAFAKLVNFLSFGQWMKESVEVSVSGNDNLSGIDHFEIQETTGSNTTTKQLEVGEVLRYEDDVRVDLQAKAVDNAGNESALSNKQSVMIDRQAPTISGVQDQEEYKHYYLPRYVGAEDLVSGIQEAYVEKDSVRTPIHEGELTAVKEEGIYHVYTIDEAGNIHELTFEIVDLPIISDFKGWDEEKEIIDQVQREFEEQYDHLDSIEKQEYDQWLKDAMKEWLEKRNDRLEDDNAGSKVEIEDKDKMDPRVTLHTDPIGEDEIPYIPKQAIAIYDAYLLKTTDQGSVEIDPVGNIKVYLPYSETEAPIVYEINDSDQVRAITVTKENGYVSFVTNKLYRYAISSSEQPDIPDPSKKHPCAYDAKINIDTNSDGKADLNIDVDGDETADINIDVDGDNRPDINIDTNLDGKADYNVDSDGDCRADLNVGPLPDPWNPDNCNEQYCTDDTLKPEVDIDTNGDGKPDINIDVDGDGEADLNLDLDGDKKPEIDIDTDLDGKPDYNVDSDGDGKEDINIGPYPDPWNPDSCNDQYCTDDSLEPELNIDTDGDGEPDVNIDTDDDGEADINIDTNGDGKPDINIDVDGDGEADLNLDLDGDKKPEIDIDTDLDGKPDYNVDSDGDGKEDTNVGPRPDPWNPSDCNDQYCTDTSLKPSKNSCAYAIAVNVDSNLDGKADLNLDVDGDGIADINIDVDGDNMPDINIDTDLDGKADYNIDTDGDCKEDLNVGPRPDPWNPDNCNDQYCTDDTLKPEVDIDTDGDGDPDINVDTNGDGKPDINIDVDGDGEADLNLDLDGDKKPDIDIDTDLDGKPDYNVDSDGDGKEDTNVGPRPDPWNPSDCNDQYCTDTSLKPGNQCNLEGKEINLDTDGDGRPDINLDIDGDCEADLNIDLNGDRMPELDIDSNGDGKADINVDRDGNGAADLNIVLQLPKWTPELNVDLEDFLYDTMSGLIPDLNIDSDGDGEPDRNVDVDGDGIPDLNVDEDWFEKHGMKNPNSASGGALTGDSTKWFIWWILVILTGMTMLYAIYRKRKETACEK